MGFPLEFSRGSLAAARAPGILLSSLYRAGASRASIRTGLLVNMMSACFAGSS
jgi:hypothetical protein